MFGTDCGFAEWIVIFIVAVIVFGPKGLPGVARKIGRFMAMIRHASDEFKAQVMAMDQQIEETAKRELQPMTAADGAPAEEPPLPPGPEAYDPTYEAFYPELAGDAPAAEEPPAKEPPA